MAKRLSKRLEVDYSNALMALFELMLSAGITTEELLVVCTKAAFRAEVRLRADRRQETGGLVTAALVLDAWHRDRRYLTADARPKAVPLLGPAPSVEAMIRSHRAHRNAAAIARRLLTLRLIVRHGKGRYLPASDMAVISAEDPLVLQHAARALSTLLETVGKNVSGTRSIEPLIERIAEIPDLPVEHVAAFKRFTQAQGRIFLRTVNDWLESRRLRSSRLRKNKTASGPACTRTLMWLCGTVAVLLQSNRRDQLLPQSLSQDFPDIGLGQFGAKVDVFWDLVSGERLAGMLNHILLA